MVTIIFFIKIEEMYYNYKTIKVKESKDQKFYDAEVSMPSLLFIFRG